MSVLKQSSACQPENTQALPPNFGRNFAIIGAIMGTAFGLFMVLFIMQNTGAV
jgi:hypothetical protein